MTELKDAQGRQRNVGEGIVGIMLIEKIVPEV